MTVLAKDGGAQTGAVFLCASNATPGTVDSGVPQVVTAAGGTDNVNTIGNTVNRATYSMPESAVVVLTSYFSLAATETLSFAVAIQESANGTSWDTAVAIQAATVVRTAVGATVTGQTNTYTLQLAGRQQYFRINVTPNLSAAGVDTCLFTAAAVLFSGWNASTLPAHQVEA